MNSLQKWTALNPNGEPFIGQDSDGLLDIHSFDDRSL